MMLRGPGTQALLGRNSSVLVAAAGGPKTATGKASQTGQRKTASGRQTSSGSSTRKPSTYSKYYNAITGFPFPLGPFFTRDTVRREVERDSIWVFEQTQALDFFQVYTPVRMTVIKLKTGGLWVHAPVAPTEECVRLIRELGAPVEHIVLPTYAYEHKMFVGPFSRAFPKAKVYIAPCQWSFPLNLPPQFFGIFPTGTLVDGEEYPWSDEIDFKVFLPPAISAANDVRITEVAFFHKRTRTLMCTDAVVYITDDVPEVIPREALLELARDGWLNRFITPRSPEEVRAIARTQPVEDTDENRRRGYRRMCLLVSYFRPGNLLEPDANFDAIADRLIVSPVVETLVFSKVPFTVCDWIDAICSDWNFRQIIPCHFTGPVKAGPAELRAAFAFAYNARDELLAQARGEDLDAPSSSGSGVAAGGAGPLGFLSSVFGRLRPAGPAPGRRPRVVDFPPEDVGALRSLDKFLTDFKLVRANADADRVSDLL